MLAGHNRQNAARIAGLKEIPAIVKEDLTDEEAWVYVLETNVIQRSFSDLTVTERIAVLAARYDKVCGTKKREEIIEELHRLTGAGGHDVHQQAKSRELIGQEYGMTGRHIARYIRCDHLIPAFKDMLDDGTLTMIAGVEVSYLSADEQKLVLSVMEQNCIKLKKDKLSEAGVLAYPLDYMVPKLPGLGDVDWGAFVSALTDIGYSGYAVAEIEDKAYEGSREDVIRSLKQTYSYLRNFIR